MNATLQTGIARLAGFWAARNTREKLILAAGGTIAVVALYVAAISTLQQKITVIQRRLPELTLNSYEISAGDKAAPRAARAGDLRSDLFKILADRGLHADLRAISSTQVEMRLPDQNAKALLNDLNTIRLASDTRVSSLQIRAAANGNAGATVILDRAP